MSFPLPQADGPSPASATSSLSYRAALAVALCLVLFRGALWVWVADAHLDSDEAIVGLMARHLLEGRAFPLFFYGQVYLLGVEAWLAAAVFAVAGASAVTLKATVLGLNLVLAWLLVRELVVSVRLAPWVALACSLFVLLPAPQTGALMGQAVGMNIEPFVATILLWRLRDRPVWFGLLLGVAFLNREFAIYSAAALLVLAVIDGRLFTRERLRDGLMASAAFAAVWDVVQWLRPYASPFGPGTTAGPSALGTTNVERVAEFAAFAPERLPLDLWVMATRYLPDLIGARREAIWPPLAQVVSWQAAWPGAWPVLTAAMLVPMAIVGAALVKERHRLADPALRFPLYLLLVGGLAAVACAAARGAGMTIFYQRYLLLSLFAPVGVAALVARFAPYRRLKGLVLGTAVAWSALAGGDQARMLAACAHQPPPAPRRELARFLVDRGVKYAAGDYWMAYSVAFVSEERVKVSSTDVTRIEEYRWLFASHRDEAAVIERTACEGCVPVAGVWVRLPGRAATRDSGAHTP